MNSKKIKFQQDYISIIEILTSERKRLGLSQKEVAKLINLSQSDISKIESLERRLDVVEFKSFINVFRIHENKNLKSKIINFLNLE